MSTGVISALSVVRGELSIHPDGSATVELRYLSAAGLIVLSRTMRIPSDPTQPITDGQGNIVAATVPAALASAVSTFASQIDSNIVAAATGGKLNL